ncbi:MAG: HD domain-containing protein [Acidobacteria bacterium]|nr:HD domain-containing protein [Acidobacteriota bacterium]
MTAEVLARSVVEELRRAGHEAYFVGGCVRDRLLDRPIKDFDVATDATPQDVKMLFPDAELVGAAFGVVLVKAGGEVVEVATYRVDHEYSDGRRPDGVTFTRSAEEDVQRRDFTINGLLYDPVERRVIDYVGGRKDLEAGIIRAIGEPARRFQEDRLRLLRAVRFAARFGFTIEAATLEAMRAQAARIADIAAERIRDELNRILTEGGARRGFELLDESGLLEHVLPEIKAMQGVEQPPQFHPEGDVWTHTLIMLEGLAAGCEPTLAMGVLLHDVGKPGTFVRAPDRIRFDGHVELGVELATAICRRLRYSHADTEQILALVKNHMRFGHVQEMRESKLKRFLRMDAFDEHLELHRLDCSSSHGNLDNYDYVRRRLDEIRSEPEGGLRPAPLLTGRDLIAAGYRPGPAFQPMLEAAEDAQLEGAVHTTAEALELVRLRFPGERPGG